MTIQVKFFASLREQFDQAQTTLKADSLKTVADVWNRATDDTVMPENTLMAINMEYVSLSDEVADGDEVAFFPPVTGG